MSVDEPDPAGARADLLRFVAACYYEPAPAFIEERLFESMRAAAGQVDSDLAASAARLGEAFAAQDLQTLLVDYTRLFLGPGQPLARPYESSWRPGDAEQAEASSTALLDLYREGGFEIDDSFQDLPDHVAVQLEFLYLLGFNENQALRTGDGAGVDTARRLRQRLIGEHLGVWIGPFAAAIRAGAETDFYRELGDFTDAVLQKAAGDAPRH
jgi:putative dimethyl sulfoxide reductase chaperone